MSNCAGKLLPLALLLAAGCGHHFHGLHGGQGQGPALAAAGPIQNPVLIPVTDHEFVWNQLVDAVDDYFKIQNEERIRVIGNEITQGRIDTFPVSGATILEPWRRDSTRGFERWQSTLQSVRRRALVTATPAPGGYLVEVAVFKELEDVDKPEFATVGTYLQRHDGTLIRTEQNQTSGSLTLGWIPLGRDATLENQIVGELLARVADQQALPPQGP